MPGHLDRARAHTLAGHHDGSSMLNEVRHTGCDSFPEKRETGGLDSHLFATFDR